MQEMDYPDVRGYHLQEEKIWKDVQLWTQVLVRFRLGWVVTSVLS